MAATKYEAWKRNYDGYGTHVDADEWSKAGFSEGYGDQVFRRSAVVCNPNECYVITTETIVEQVRVPGVTMHGSSSPAKGGQLNLYESEDGGSSPINKATMKVYWDAHNRGNMSLSPPHKTGVTSPKNWKERPNSNGSGESTDSWKDGYPEKRGHLKLYEVDDNGGSSPVRREPMKVYGVADNRRNMSLSPPHKTGLTSPANWKERPNSNGSGMSTNSWKDGYPAKGGHFKPYEIDDNGGSSPVSRVPVKVYEVDDNRRNMSVSPPHKTSPMSIMNWKQKLNSNGHGGNPDNWKDGAGTGTNTYGGQNGSASNGIHPHFEGYHGRNEMVTDTKQKPNKIIEAGVTGVDKWKETRKSPTVMTAPIRPVSGKPTQGRFKVPPSVAPEEIFPSTIDSREAARRFGGYSVPPQVIKEANTYTPTIDSNKAAKWYKGQIL